MSAATHSKPLRDPSGKKGHFGPLDWRTLVEWLSEDGVISAAEAQRTISRCSQVQSAQPPLMRLANVGMTRVADGKPLDIETMMEENLRRALLLSRGDWSVFVTRPLSAGLLGAALLLLIIVLLPSVKNKREEAFVEE